MNLTQYYGTDYANAVAIILAMYLIGNKRRSGFVFFMIATGCGTVFGILTESVPFIISNVLLFITNLRAFILWRSKPVEAAKAA